MWLISGSILCLIGFTVVRDEARVQDRIKAAIEGEHKDVTSDQYREISDKDEYIQNTVLTEKSVMNKSKAFHSSDHNRVHDNNNNDNETYDLCEHNFKSVFIDEDLKVSEEMKPFHYDNRDNNIFLKGIGMNSLNGFVSVPLHDDHDTENEYDNNDSNLRVTI